MYPDPTQDWQEWTDIHGTPLEPDQAWRMFDDWKTAQKEIGLRYISQLSRFGTFGTLRSVRQGTVQIESDLTAATFDLKEARFT